MCVQKRVLVHTCLHMYVSVHADIVESSVNQYMRISYTGIIPKYTLYIRIKGYILTGI
jgi:hypothetical protein